jgi:hypothetical protein
MLAALKTLLDKKPVYSHAEGVNGWWGEVIRQTAVGAGADPSGTHRDCKRPDYLYSS